MKLKINSFSLRFALNIVFYSANTFLISFFLLNLFTGSFFQNFAYLLPCLVNSVLNVLSFIMVFFLLPETLASKR